MKKNNKPKVPISLHIYSSLLLVTLISILIISFSSQIILRIYIDTECNRRISRAVVSCQKFGDAFRQSILPDDTRTKLEIRADILSQVAASTDLSSDASTILYYSEPESVGNSISDAILWPTETANERASIILEEISKQDGLQPISKTKRINIEGSEIYYRIISIEYSESISQHSTEYEKYYMLIYLDSSTYFGFSRAFQIVLLRSFIFALLAATIISIICAYPLYSSINRLARFANRIGKGDFTPVNGSIVSRELSDLKDVMNLMAARLNESDREQKTFFQNASHELRTPLMSIQGYAEGLKYDVFDEEHKEEALNIIIDETTRLSNLVENLLSISKMDMAKSGGYSIKKSMIDVTLFSDILIDKVRGGFLLNNKELINDISINDVYVYGNENDLFRMLENIFSNCLRYCENAVTFKVYSDNSDVHFEVSDDGPGISSEVLSKMYERFSKGEDGKHGIGLALAKSIAEEHGGKITASNKTGADENGYEIHGAKFVISIPTGKRREQLSNLNL